MMYGVVVGAWGGGGVKVRKVGDEGAKRAGKRRGKDSVWGA